LWAKLSLLIFVQDHFEPFLSTISEKGALAGNLHEDLLE